MEENDVISYIEQNNLILVKNKDSTDSSCNDCFFFSEHNNAENCNVPSLGSKLSCVKSEEFFTYKKLTKGVKIKLFENEKKNS